MTELNIDAYMARLITQYKHSENLKFFIRTRLEAINTAMEAFPDPTKIDVDTNTGELLTLVGKILGFGRIHTVTKDPAIFGFDEDDVYKIVGFDEGGEWLDLADFGQTGLVISDDEYYRKFLKVRQVYLLGKRDVEAVEKCARILWGDDAGVLDSGNGRTVIATGRELTESEKQFWQIYAKIFPVPLGTRAVFHEGDMRVLGFGLGWGEFDEVVYPDGLPLMTDKGLKLITNNDEEIFTSAITADAPWMEEFDPLKIGEV